MVALDQLFFTKCSAGPILWLYHLEITPVYHHLLYMALCVRERTHDGKTPHNSLSAISCQGDQKPWCWSPKQTKESLKWKFWLIRYKQKVMAWIKHSHRVWACHFTSQEDFLRFAIRVTAVTVNMADPHKEPDSVEKYSDAWNDKFRSCSVCLWIKLSSPI